MKESLETTRESQKNTVQRVQQETSTGGSATISDNRPETIQQRKVKTAIDTSVSNNPIIQQKQSLVPSNMVTERSRSTVASTPLSNQTGLPNNLKSGIENLSGFSMNDVKVHYNSCKPAQLQAYAYAQGTDIHVAPNQEKHLPHEAWHVVQQKQGRVKPTKQLKSKVHINDDAGLEKEADVMGSKASSISNRDIRFENNTKKLKVKSVLNGAIQQKQVIQRYFIADPVDYQTQGGGANNPSFTSQVKGQGTNSFLNGQAPILDDRFGNNLPQIRVSDNGSMAIEDAQLLNRQPKFFYAEANKVTEWNEKLLINDSLVTLIPVNTAAITLADPNINGAVKTLVKIKAQKRALPNQAMTLIQDCECAAREVTGGRFSPSFLNPPFPLPSRKEYNIAERGYYIAAELAKHAQTRNPANLNVNNWGFDGIPLGLSNSEMAEILIEIGNDYGHEMHEHMHNQQNGNLDTRMRHLGVNKYATPEVGQGMKTVSLGAVGDNGNGKEINDAYNNRPIDLTQNNGNDLLWGYHYGGVVAKDGSDYITLENHARNAEDNIFVSNQQDPRFYFQMYGAGVNQSWHEQWTDITQGGRTFYNPLSHVVSVDQTPEVYNERALRDYGNNLANIRGQHTIAINTLNSEYQLFVFLLKGLVYANDLIERQEYEGDRQVSSGWLSKVRTIKRNNLHNVRINSLCEHVIKSLKKTDFTVGRKIDRKLGLSSKKKKVGVKVNSIGMSIAKPFKKKKKVWDVDDMEIEFL